MNRGTRDAIALFKVIMQRALTMYRKLYICVVDYKKVFDKVSHNKIVGLLKRVNADREEVQLISKLYWHQSANIRINNRVTEALCGIQRGVRRECPLSPRLFNLYAEFIAEQSTLQKAGFKINGKKFGSISNADHKMVIPETPQQLQRMVTVLNRESRKYDMRINVGKTEVMKIEKVKENKSTGATLALPCGLPGHTALCLHLLKLYFGS